MDPKQFITILKEELKPIINEALKPILKTQEEHTDKIDAITAELHNVHQLATTTLDVVKGRYEKNKREIDEIKDHLHLPKEPYFGNQP